MEADSDFGLKETGERVNIQQIEACDDAFYYEVYASTRAEEISAWGWPELQSQHFLHMQFQFQQRSYEMQYPNLARYIVMVDEERAGRLYLAREEQRWVLVDLSLLPAYRGLGVGTQLLKNIQDEAALAGREVELQVRRENPARRLYERTGFTYTGEDELSYRMCWRSSLERG
ncbi:GNAT family N-acetyltransferase [Marinicrinis sediminis]|uniref:GNAT family N-acetyltransferase n=1 Tax=Marinicrinis sediminis TaxID=1652465 RepID=A0ABW5RHH6_9BACL